MDYETTLSHEFRISCQTVPRLMYWKEIRHQQILLHLEFHKERALGPLLFLVYINDMPGYARSQTRLFADDCLMYRKVSSTSDCTQLQEDLDNLIKWEQQWQMQFNPDKCEVLTITKKRKPLHHTWTHTPTC